MTIEYIISRSDTYHIPLYNYENKYCYWLSILQRLHTSNTLNRCIIDYFTNNPNAYDIESILLKPVYIYAGFDCSDTSNANIIRIYDNIRSYMIEYIPQIVHSNAQNGYLPETLLVQYYCPIIFHLFKSSFVSIIDEIHINKIEFEASLSVVDDAMCSKSQFLKDEENQKYFFSLYKQMAEFIFQNVESFKLEPFVSATVEVFPNKDHTGGHAITLLYGISNIDKDNETFYIIDDQRSISPLHTYYTNRNERIYELSLRDISDVTVANINDILHKQSSIDPNCKFSKRVTRYSLCFEDNFLSPSDELIKSEFRNKSTDVAELHPPTPPVASQPNMDKLSDIIETYSQQPNKPIQAFSYLSAPSMEKLISMLIVGFVVGMVVGVLVTLAAWKHTPKSTTTTNSIY